MIAEMAEGMAVFSRVFFVFCDGNVLCEEVFTHSEELCVI